MFKGTFTDDFGGYMREFAEFKYKAFKLGKTQGTVAALRKLIRFTNYTSGDLAEIVLAYMLGIFCAYHSDLYVAMTANLDKNGVDFMLTRFRKYNYPIQVKFNKENDHFYSDDITVVELGGDFDSFRATRYIDAMRGDYALFLVLIECDAYNEEEVCDFLEIEGIADLLKEAWRIIVN